MLFERHKTQKEEKKEEKKKKETHTPKNTQRPTIAHLLRANFPIISLWGGFKLAGKKGMHKSSKGFDFGHIQTADIGVTWP